MSKVFQAKAKLALFRQETRVTMSRMTNKKQKEYKLDQDILWFTGRLSEMNSIRVNDLDFESFFDNVEIKSILPVVDSDSPLFYALVVYIHTKVRPHSGVEVTLRDVSKHMHVITNPHIIIQHINKDCTK